jgi:cytochrome P450
MSHENSSSVSSPSLPAQELLRLGIAWDGEAEMWRARGHANARILLADPHLDAVRDVRPNVFLAENRDPSAVEFLESWFSRAPRECHYAVKRHLYRPYAQPSVAAETAMMESVARDCAQTLPVECDLVADYFMPFWLRTTGHMFGVQEKHHKLLANVANALSKALAMDRLNESATRAVEACARSLRALLELMLAIEEPSPMVRALRELAGDPQVGGIWSAASALSQLLAAGLQPTITGAAFAWRALHEQPGLMGDVRAAKFDLSDLVTEVLRLHPPFPFMHRWVHERCECQGVVFQPGAHVLIDVRAANRDPEVFDQPDEYIAGRDHKLSLSFGHGPHRCVGPALAEMQIAIALRALLELQPPVLPVAKDPKAGKEPLGHLVAIKSLPCRREPGPRHPEGNH